MTKCDYCGEKIGLFSVMYTWLEKKEGLAIHDKCLKEWDEKFPDRQKEYEKYSQIDYKTLTQDDVKKITDNFIKDLQKDILYLVRGKKMKILPKEEMIKHYEKNIEVIKKDKNYVNKEKTLELYNELLKQLKNEDGDQKEIYRLQKEINQYTQQNLEIKLAEARNRFKEISWQDKDWKYIIVSVFMGILLGLIFYFLKNP